MAQSKVEIEEKLRMIICIDLAIPYESVLPTDRFKVELAFNRKRFEDLYLGVEMHFDCCVPDSHRGSIKTVGDLAEYITLYSLQSQMGETNSSASSPGSEQIYIRCDPCDITNDLEWLQAFHYYSQARNDKLRSMNLTLAAIFGGMFGVIKSLARNEVLKLFKTDSSNVNSCPYCGKRLRLLDKIEDPLPVYTTTKVVRKILSIHDEGREMILEDNGHLLFIPSYSDFLSYCCNEPTHLTITPIEGRRITYHVEINDKAYIGFITANYKS